MAPSLNVAQDGLGHQWEKRSLVQGKVSDPVQENSRVRGQEWVCVWGHTHIEAGGSVYYRVSGGKPGKGITFAMQINKIST